MGDRGNIVFKQESGAKPDLWMYGHWAGHDMPNILQAALKKGLDRWNDEPYLARIVFQELVGKDNGTTGFGLTTYPTDNEYPVIIVDAGKMTVGAAKYPSTAAVAWIPFTRFVELTEKELETFRDDMFQPPLCSICRRHHGREIEHACE